MSCSFKWGDKMDLMEKVVSVRRLRGGEQVSHVDVCGKKEECVLQRTKALGWGAPGVCSRSSQEAIVPGGTEKV